MYQGVLFDFETLAKRSNAVVLDLSAVVFNLDQIDNFDDLINDSERTFSVKFDVQDQVTNWKRTIHKGTLQWWSDQGPEAKKILLPNKELDKSLVDGMNSFKEFVVKHDIFMNKNKLAYVRGQSFDFPILCDIGDQIWPEISDDDNFPVYFWNQRDTRTAISHDMMTPNNTRCPLPKGIFKNFVKHNSTHDCIKDVISLQHCWAYKTGKMELPEEYDMY